MYRVTMTVANAQQLGLLLDKGMRLGVTLEALTLVQKPQTNGPVDRETKRKQAPPGESQGKVLKIVQHTFPDSEFSPKQIRALAVSRGVSAGSLYGVLIQLAAEGKLSRPREGFYKLAPPIKKKGNEHASKEG